MPNNVIYIPDFLAYSQFSSLSLYLRRKSSALYPPFPLAFGSDFERESFSYHPFEASRRAKFYTFVLYHLGAIKHTEQANYSTTRSLCEASMRCLQCILVLCLDECGTLLSSSAAVPLYVCAQIYPIRKWYGGIFFLPFRSWMEWCIIRAHSSLHMRNTETTCKISARQIKKGKRSKAAYYVPTASFLCS